DGWVFSFFFVWLCLSLTQARSEGENPGFARHKARMSPAGCAFCHDSCVERLSMRLLINRRPVLAALVLLAVLDCRSTLRAAEQRVADPKELPRFQPVAAGDALNSFQLRKGFHLE